MKKIILLSSICVVCLSYFFLLPTSIVSFYKSENDNGSYIATIRMAPKNMTDAIKFWQGNKRLILDKTKGLNEGKYILFVKDDFEDESDDDSTQLCLPKQIKNREKCINYSDRLFSVTRKKENGVYLYLLNQEDVYLKSGISCLFFDYDNGSNEYLGCNENAN